jgi:O-antigen/teichoic acid export membrane protein
VSKAIKLARTSAKGGFNLFWGVATSSLISALGVILVARILSPSEYGLVAIALIAPSLIQIIRDLGIDQATIKYTSQYNQENKQANIKNILAAEIAFELLLGSALSVVSYLLSGFLATNIFNRPEITSLIQMASFTIFGHALLKAAQSAFTGYEKMEYHSTILIIQSALKAGLMILLVLLGLGAYGAVVGHTIAYLIAGLISIILLYIIVYKNLRKENHKLEFFVTIKKMLKYGLPISGSMILTGFLAQFYSFLIAIYLSDQIVGNYQAAINFSVIVTFFVTPVTTTLFPVFSKVNPEKEPETLRSVFRFSVKYASLLVVPATFMLMALSKPAVYTLFGTKYEYTPLYLALYIVFYLYTAFGHLSAGNILKGQGKTQLHLKITLIKSLIGVILSLTLIPTFGIFGFLAAHLAADIPSLIISLWWIKKHYNATIDWISSTKILSSAATAAAITYVVTDLLNLVNWVTLIIGAVIFLAAYLVTAPLMGAINHADIKNLKEMLKALGPLASIFNIPLYLIEKLTVLLQKPENVNQ